MYVSGNFRLKRYLSIIYASTQPPNKEISSCLVYNYNYNQNIAPYSHSCNIRLTIWLLDLLIKMQETSRLSASSLVQNSPIAASLSHPII